MSVPMLCGNFNDWQQQPMMDLFSFLRKNDPNPPDFISRMVDEGLCKPSCRQYPGSMDEHEQRLLKERQMKYYNKAAIKIILDIIPFQKP